MVFTFSYIVTKHNGYGYCLNNTFLCISENYRTELNLYLQFERLALESRQNYMHKTELS